MAQSAILMEELACELDVAVVDIRYPNDDPAAEPPEVGWIVYRDDSGLPGQERWTPDGRYWVQRDADNPQVWRAGFLPESHLSPATAAILQAMIPKGFDTLASAQATCDEHAQQVVYLLAKPQRESRDRADERVPPSQPVAENAPACDSLDRTVDTIFASFGRRLFDAGYMTFEETPEIVAPMRQMLRRSIKEALETAQEEPQTYFPEAQIDEALTSKHITVCVRPQVNQVRMSLEPVVPSNFLEMIGPVEPVEIDLSAEETLGLIEQMVATLDVVTARRGSLPMVGDTLRRLLAVVERFGDHRAV